MLSLSNEAKNSLSLSNERKGTDITWDQATFTWDNAGPQTWDANGFLILTNESKTTLTLSNEAKL